MFPQYVLLCDLEPQRSASTPSIVRVIMPVQYANASHLCLVLGTACAPVARCVPPLTQRFSGPSAQTRALQESSCRARRRRRHARLPRARCQRDRSRRPGDRHTLARALRTDIEVCGEREMDLCHRVGASTALSTVPLSTMKLSCRASQTVEHVGAALLYRRAISIVPVSGILSSECHSAIGCIMGSSGP